MYMHVCTQEVKNQLHRDQNDNDKVASYYKHKNYGRQGTTPQYVATILPYACALQRPYYACRAINHYHTQVR